MYSLTNRTSDPFEDIFSLANIFFPKDFRTIRDDLSNVGLKKFISRPHNLETVRDENGNAVGQRLSLVYTPFKKDQIKVSVEGDDLMVSIGDETKEEKKDENGDILYKGISTQSTRFSLKLTDKIDKKAISAKAEEGMLFIELPFATEKEPETIEVKII